MRHNRRILAVIVVISVCFLLFGCQEQTKAVQEAKTTPTVTESITDVQKNQTPPQPHEAAPKITFERAVHNFGKVAPGTYNNCEFKFTNTGEGMLNIGRIQSTCGCAVPELIKKEYAPGESGTVKVQYHSGTRPGSVTRLLYVQSNDKTNPKAKLAIKANIVKRVDYEPKTLTLSLKDENAGCPQITLTSLDNTVFAIKNFKSTGDFITVEYDPEVTNTEFVIQPQVDIDKLQNRLKGQIDFTLTHPGCKSVTIPFRAMPRFKADPASLIIFDAKPKEPIKRQLWVLSNYDEDFEIVSALSKNGIVKVLSQEKLGNRYKFELQITAPPDKGKRRIFTDRFSVRIKGGPKLDIACRGFYPRNK